MDRLATIAKETLAPHRTSGERVEDQGHRTGGCLPRILPSPDRRGPRHVERHYDTDAKIDVIPGELRQVFTNLISNAIDAMPQGGSLELEVFAEGQDVKLIFSDTGTGINPEKLEEIFEPFVTTKGEKGLGIGLWISRNIVEKLGGTIHVRSTTGEGRPRHPLHHLPSRRPSPREALRVTSASCHSRRQQTAI